jgi:hypothetical protein
MAAPGPGPSIKAPQPRRWPGPRQRTKTSMPPKSRTKTPTPRPLRRMLPAAAAVIGATVFAALILYLITQGLSLVAHAGL